MKSCAKIASKHPLLFRQGLDFGIQCGPGWIDIIYKLADKLEKCIEDLDEEDTPQFYAVQIKEKYGTLRFYMSMETDEMSHLIEDAEALSAITCEECGKPGKLRVKNRWYTTLCSDCWVKYDAKV